MSNNKNEFKLDGSARVLQILDDLEDKTLNLWNIIEMRDISQDNKKIEFAQYTSIKLGLMYFVCLLLSVHALMLNKRSLKIRVMNHLLKSYYSCIDEDNENLAKTVKDYTEKLIDVIESTSDTVTDIKFQTLKTEFYMLDMHASLVANDISMAKHYELKADICAKIKMFKKETIFNICRTIFNDGLKLYQEQKIDEAYYFLEKCFLILEKINIDQSKIENKIKVSTLILLSKCCIKLNTEESLEKVEKLIKYLSLNESKKIEAFKLQLELIQLKNTDINKIEDDLMKFVISIPSDSNVLKQTGMVFNSFAEKQPFISKNCLVYLFTHKISFSEREFKEVGESYLISLIWILTSKLSSKPIGQVIELTKEILELADKKMVSELTYETCNSLIIMLFSAGKKQIKEGNFQLALDWFSCCNMRLFITSLTNDEVKGKIQRSVLQCCLERKNYDLFKNTFDSMSSLSQKNPISLYYKFVYLLKTDSTNSQELSNILDTFGKIEDSKTIKLLALCVIECKEMEPNKPQLNAPLKSSIKKLLNRCFDENIEGNANIIVVALRSCFLIYGKNIELMVDLEESIDIIVKSVNQLIKFEKELKDLSTDIEWLASNCYNHALILQDKEGFESYAIRLFDCCIKLITCLKEENYFKWYCKAHVFKSLCNTRIIKSGCCNSVEEEMQRWNEIYNENISIIKRMTSGNIPQGCDYVLKQSNMLLLETLVFTEKYEELLSLLKTKNKLGNKFQEQVNDEVDYFLQIFLDKNSKTDIKDFEMVKQILDLIFIERAFKQEYGVGAKRVFKWIYLLVNRWLGFFELDNMLVKLIRLFKEFLINTLDKTVHESEMGWLAGVCWNRGIEILMEKNNMDEEMDELDTVSTADSSVISDGIVITSPAKPHTQPKDKGSASWCETAIFISESPLQKEHMQQLLKQL